jgi:beta-glucosidase
MAQETRSSATQDSPADVRAREVEEQMTNDERFSLLVSVMGSTPQGVWPRDERIPEGTPMSDASLGVINPGYREGDTATALPAGTALGSSFNP